jgi:hypothetical protein
MIGIDRDPGGLIHFRRRTAITAAKPPFAPTFTQNQSIAGRKSHCGLATGRGWPKRGKPSIALRILFNSSHTERIAATCPAKAIAVWTGAAIKTPWSRVSFTFSQEKYRQKDRRRRSIVADQPDANKGSRDRSDHSLAEICSSDFFLRSGGRRLYR